MAVKPVLATSVLFLGSTVYFPELRRHPLLFFQGLGHWVRFAGLAARLFILYKNPFSKLTIEEKNVQAGQYMNITLRKNSGISIKLGQALAMMEVLLPDEFTDQLLSLFQEAPQSKFEDIKAEIEEQLGRKFDDVFSEFVPQPIASGSIAQVYQGTLRDSGKKVAVKVRHAFLREIMEFDLAIMRFFISLGHFLDKDFNFRWLYDDASQNLRKETDFAAEAANIAKISELMKGYQKLVFPRVFPEFSSGGVLTMEFIEGYSVTDVDRLKQDNIQLDQIARTMAESFAKMIFQLGFVHADPHPGNLFVQRDPKGDWQLVLLDNGLYAELSEVTRLNYSKLWVGIINRDEEMLKEATEKLGVGFAHRLFTSMITKQEYAISIESTEGDLKKRLKGTNPAEEKRRINAAHARKWRKQILECLEKVNRDMILLFKIHNYIEAIDTKLGQPINNYWYTAKFAFQTYLKSPALGWLQRSRGRLQMWTVFFWLLVYEWGLILKLKTQQ